MDDTSTIERATPAHVPAQTGVERARRTALSVLVESRGQLVDVRRGDLLIANRLSRTQAVMNLSKDPWTHAAVVGEVDGGLVAIELGPKGCGWRSLRDFAAAYRIVGVGRPAMHPECVDAVASTAELHAAVRDVTYSWDACRVLESVALLRCYLPASAEPVVIRLGQAWARRMLRRERPDALTCAGFVDVCLAAACPSCRPVPAWPRRARPSPFRGMPPVVDLWRGHARHLVTDPVVVRALSTPADLWLAECWRHRVVHRHGRTTVIVDLDDADRREEVTVNPNPNPNP